MHTSLDDALRAFCAALGVEFYDLRDILPERSQYRERNLAHVRGLAYHHQAARPTPKPAPASIVAALLQRGQAVAQDGGRWLRAVWRVAEYQTGPDSHLADDGAPGIAYTLVTDPDGGLYLVNDPEEAPWSQGYARRPGDENAEWMSVLFMGFMRSEEHPDGDSPTPMQIAIAALLPMALKRTWSPAIGWDLGETTAHAWLGKPACPGSTLKAVVLSYMEHGPHRDTSPELDSWLGRQRGLNRVLSPSPGLTEDGTFGPRTKAALRRFQREQGLTADGMWGPRTRAALEAALSA